MSVVRGIRLRRYELESLIKSFLLFFILMLSLYLLSEWQNYKAQVRQLDNTILNEMQVFSYKPLSGEFDVSFVPHKEGVQRTLTLYKEENTTYGLFEIPGSKSYLLKVSLTQEKYRQRLDALKAKILDALFWYVLLIAIVSLLLAYYTLYPLKKALQLNEEFVKDIQHDINTPLSALLLNLSLLKRRFGEDRGFERMTHSVETIQNLQSNLSTFLHGQTQEMDYFNLYDLLEGRMEYFRALYPQVAFSLDVDSEVSLFTNREGFMRMIDNLLSNAGKYNVKEGEVHMVLAKKRLRIEDTGRGIRHPERVFGRYYKEGERGLGLGLHIVQKLGEELGIDIGLKSKEGKGTTVTLKLAKVIVESQS